MEYTKDREEILSVTKEHRLEECFSFLDAYQRHLRIFRAGKREQVFGNAMRRKEIYILLTGRVKVYTILSSGRQLLLDYYDKRELFGEYILSDLPEEEGNHFYTETLTDVMGIALHVTPVKELLMEDVKFLHFYIRCLQQRFVQLGNCQPMNVLNSSQRNVAGYIWSKFCRRTDQTRPFYFHENLREVSELMGISYRHLHRVLRKLVEQGVLERTGKGYLLKNEQELKKIVDQQ
ncbi:MAG: Crp/Fnr family transcriptional regulator [Lachnospiraceae bacterium]|nr:Crp/Fnr family transcriptional regulator [Lachnospiraceae bacterium]